MERAVAAEVRLEAGSERRALRFVILAVRRRDQRAVHGVQLLNGRRLDASEVIGEGGGELAEVRRRMENLSYPTARSVSSYAASPLALRACNCARPPRGRRPWRAASATENLYAQPWAYRRSAAQRRRVDTASPAARASYRGT